MLTEQIQYYIDVGNEFEQLYGGEPTLLEEFFQQENLPRYQIYTHNCDTVARELLALISTEIAEYNTHSGILPSGGHYKRMCRILGKEWGIRRLGEDSVWENVLADY